METIKYFQGGLFLSSNKFTRTTRTLANQEEYEYIQKTIENFDLRILFNYKYSLYRCIIQDGSKKYESNDFTFDSHYQDGLIQDVLGEIESSYFYTTFGRKKQHYIKRELKKLLTRSLYRN